MNRLTTQASTDGYNTAYTYNLNASPLTVMRRGLSSDGTVGTVDDLTMTYSGNRLTKTVDSAEPVLLESSMDFPSAEALYGYDSDGRMISDTSRGITDIRYNPAGRPAAIEMHNGDRLNYCYDATNRKLSESYQSSNGTSTLYYVGALEFVQEATDTVPHLVRSNLPWGYLDANGKEYRYISDYQGNIRTVVDSTGTTVQTTDYYPYGLPMATSTGATVNPYKYSGKEFETGSGLSQYDFAARHYPAALPLFNRPDDKAIDYPATNPYLYCAANPLRYVDPTGEKLYYKEDNLQYDYRIVDSQIAVYDMNGNALDQSSLSLAQQTTLEYLNEYINSNIGNQLISEIISSDKTVTMTYDPRKSNKFDPETGTLYFNPYKNESGISFNEARGTYSRDGTATINLSHEVGHAEDWIKGTLDNNIWVNLGNGDKVANSEIHACWRENQYRFEIGFPLRVAYAAYVKGDLVYPVWSTFFFHPFSYFKKL